MSDLALRPMRDAATMTGRGIRLSRRDIEALLTSLMLPVILMLLFVYLFGGAMDVGTRYVNYVVPGVIILCAGFGAATTAVRVSQDLATGVLDRFRSMDVHPAALIAGHVAASVLRNLASAVLVFAVAIAIGFRPHASVAGWFGAIGILVAFMLAVSWVSATIGVVAGSPEAANGFTFVFMFLPYPSSAFVPVNTMPTWLRGFANHQPCTAFIESVRHLLAGSAAGTAPAVALIWTAGILAVAIPLTSVAFRRHTR